MTRDVVNSAALDELIRQREDAPPWEKHPKPWTDVAPKRNPMEAQTKAATEVVVKRQAGRFAAGNPGGPGRPRGSSGINLRSLIEAQAMERGVDLEQVVWDVFHALIERAKKGDVGAAKLVLDRLCVRTKSIDETPTP